MSKSYCAKKVKKTLWNLGEGEGGGGGGGGEREEEGEDCLPKDENHNGHDS